MIKGMPHGLRGRVIASLLLPLSAMPIVALAHAGLVSSEPGRRAVLSASPKQIRLCFNENVEASFSKVFLENAEGKPFSLPPPVRDPGKASCLLVPLPSLAIGSYSVKYKVLSVDGHVVEYGYGFRVQSAGAVDD